MKKLDFNAYIKEQINKTNSGIGLIRKLQGKLPRNALLTIYKFFIRPHLYYGDIVYDQPTNKSLGEKLESVQYDTALAMTGAINEFGLESLIFRRKLRCLCKFYKIKAAGLPTYLFRLIPCTVNSYQTRTLTVTTNQCR